MNIHPTLIELLDRSSDPDIQEHLSSCPPCRAQLRLLSDVDSADPSDLPGIERARGALDSVRAQASLHLSQSIGGLRPEDASIGGEPEDLPVGHTVERYTVEALVGRGGMGAVYRVRHDKLGSRHALKVLHRTSGSVRQRLEREGQAQSRLHHPHVVPVTDIVDVNGAPGLIMEFVDGPTLAAWLREHGRPPFSVVDQLGEQVIRGVAAAHRAGIVHRDLKPGNILLAQTDEGYSARVTDFGLARPLDDQQQDLQLTRPDTPLGTPSYMAPEQIRDASRADARSDIFSLGAVLYELVTGQRAFAGADILEIFDRVRSGPAIPVHEVVPKAPSRWVETIERALDPEPDQRFADCAELLASWRGQPISDPVELTGEEEVPGCCDSVDQAESAAVAATTSEPAAAAPRRTWPRIAGGGLAVGVAALAVVLLDRGDPVESTAAGPEPAAQPELADRRLTALPDDVQTFSVALNSDGSKMVHSNGLGVWMVDVESGESQQLLAGGPIHDLDWFPGDEQLMASGWLDGDQGTWRLSLDGSEPELLFPRMGHLAALSPDGQRVAMADDSGLWVMGSDGSGRTRLRPLSAGDGTGGIAWSPSGRAIAAIQYSAASGSAWIEITAADGSSTRRLDEDPELLALGLGPVAWVPPDRLLFTRDAFTSPTVYALDGAETAPDASAAQPLHSWNGFSVIRLRPSRDGSRIAYSRVDTASLAYVLSLDPPGSPRKLSREDWAEWPVGWRSNDEVLVGSDRGGGGLFAEPVDGGGATPVLTTIGKVSRAQLIDGQLFYSGYEGKEVEEPEAFWLARAEADGAQPRTLMRTELPKGDSDAKHGAWIRCVPGRCLVARRDDETLSFAWMDAETGTMGPRLFSLQLETRAIALDLSPSGRKLAILQAMPSRLQVRDLETGQWTEHPGPFEMPSSVAWAPDEQRLYAAGVGETDGTPYAVVAMDLDGTVRSALWSSMAWHFHALTPSPDGRTLAVGVHAFDDDVWLLEGAATATGEAFTGQ